MSRQVLTIRAKHLRVTFRDWGWKCL